MLGWHHGMFSRESGRICNEGLVKCSWKGTVCTSTIRSGVLLCCLRGK
jgi:hypothetical protein